MNAGGGRGTEGFGGAGTGGEAVRVIVAEAPGSDFPGLDEFFHGEAEVFEGGWSALTSPVGVSVCVDVCMYIIWMKRIT